MTDGTDWILGDLHYFDERQRGTSGLKNLITYPGGKFYLMNEILGAFQRCNQHVAIDVFGGSGKFLLNVKAENKIYNDIDSRIVNLFEVLKSRPDELMRRCESTLYSRELFDRFKSEPVTGDPVEDAYMTFYIFQASFAGKGGTFGYNVCTDSSLPASLDRSINRLHDLATEIKDWTIEHLDFRDLMERYDRPESFFYLDPPYHGHKFYEHNFTDRDFIDLAGILRKLKGSYLMNINKTDFVLDTFGEPSWERDMVNHCIVGKAGSTKSVRTELFYFHDSKHGSIMPPEHIPRQMSLDLFDGQGNG